MALFSDDGRGAILVQHRVVENGRGKYVEVACGGAPLCSERDALDLVAACGGADTGLLLIHDEALSDDFFRLRTGLAGAVLQKFSNYGIKAVLVLTDEKRAQGKFRDLLIELNRGGGIRAFGNAADAENWLLAQSTFH